MSWGRFLIAAVIVSVLLLPLAPAISPILADIGEPLRTVVIVAGALALFLVVDRMLAWLVGRLDGMRTSHRTKRQD